MIFIKEVVNWHYQKPWYEYTTLLRPTIAGKQIPFDDDGVATYIFTADKAPGKHIVPVTIQFTKPDGSDMTISKNLRYEVAKPH